MAQCAPAVVDDLWVRLAPARPTIARLLAKEAGYEFQQLSAVSQVSRTSRKRSKPPHATHGRPVHPAVRRRDPPLQPRPAGRLPALRREGIVTLVGATTENPSFEAQRRAAVAHQVYVLRRLDEAALQTLLTKAEEHEGRTLPLDPASREAIVAMADGRRPLSALAGRDPVQHRVRQAAHAPGDGPGAAETQPAYDKDARSTTT